MKASLTALTYSGNDFDKSMLNFDKSCPNFNLVCITYTHWVSEWVSEWQGRRMIGHEFDKNIPINQFLKWNVPWAIWLHLVLKKSNGCNLWRLTSSNPGRFRAGLYQSRKWENQQRINYSVARVINGAFQEWRMKIKLLGLHSSQSTEQLAGSIGGWHMPGPITGWSNRPLWLPSCACSLLSSDPWYFSPLAHLKHTFKSIHISFGINSAALEGLFIGNWREKKCVERKISQKHEIHLKGNMLYDWLRLPLEGIGSNPIYPLCRCIQTSLQFTFFWLVLQCRECIILWYIVW